MAVAAHYGATVAWHCEFDKHPSGILAHHYPDIPNHHDVTSVDWAAVEPVDILTGGYPCQPFSHAGTRKGTNDERHLWPYVADSLRVLRPRLAVFENVAGHLSLGFDTVLADLAALGFDAEWVVVRASDAGAPHRRERLFIVAADAARERGDGGWYAGPRRWAELADGGGDADGLTLLPTPAVNDMGRGKSVEDWDEWTAAMQQRHGNGNGHGKSLAIEAQRLLPTPNTSDALGAKSPEKIAEQRARTPGGYAQLREAALSDFGPYAAAIARWEQVLGRPAPQPTEPGQNGRPRLSPRFVEWMMGLPDGWVTGVDIPRNAQLKALGNGVVPAQAALALALLDGDGALPTAGDVPLLPTPKATNNENRQSLDRYGMNLGQALGVTPLKAGDA